MAEVQLLKNWVNPQYLSTETMKQIEQTFHSTAIPSVQLANFLLPEKADAVYKRLEKLKLIHEYIPHMHSFHTADAEKQLAEFYSFLNSSGFKSLIGTMIKKEIKVVYQKVLVYEHTNYTLLHDIVEQRLGTVLFFDFTKSWNENAGGKTIFVSPNTEPLLFSRIFNAVTITALQPDVRYFVKYVNAEAKNNKVFLIKVECG